VNIANFVNRCHLVSGYYAGHVRLSGFPVHLKIELTNFCNLDCRMCARQKMTRQVGFMNRDLCYEILDWASRHCCEFVYLHFLGESLYHPDLQKIVRTAHSRGIRVGLSTNATVLDEAIAHGLIDSGIDLLVIAVDSPRQDQYEFLRKGASWTEVIENTLRFARICKSSCSRTILVVQMVHCDLTADEGVEFLKFWGDNGLASDKFRLIVKQWDDWAGQMAEVREWNTKTSPSVLRDLRPCVLPWRELSVQWDGTVVPCSRFFDKQLVVGSLGSSDLTRVWNDDEMVELRCAHLKNSTASVPVCQGCPRQAMRPWSYLRYDQFALRLRHYCSTGNRVPKRGLS
jgi:radical SAM protein with 4Fe4S-binding SPASM domain